MPILTDHLCSMAVAMDSPKSSLGLWTEALQAKYEGKGKKWGREEFDKLLGNFDGICDVPGCLFVEEFREAYPEAKIVLTTRDVDAWLRSMQSTAGTMLVSKLMGKLYSRPPG